MKGVTLDGFGASPVVRDDLPHPTPAASEVLVRVRASSIHPIDAVIAGGMRVLSLPLGFVASPSVSPLACMSLMPATAPPLLCLGGLGRFVGAGLVVLEQPS